jgi:hypothetical protein
MGAQGNLFVEDAYVIRVLVDVRFRPDAAIERPVAIV